MPERRPEVARTPAGGWTQAGKKWGWVGLVAVCAGLGWYGWGARGEGERVYRIGYENDPPFHYRGVDGRAAGLAVEIVSEAAAEEGVRLEWVYQTDGVERALRERRVELWPLLTVRPERVGVFHISKPFLETENSLAVRRESAIRALRDTAGQRIAYQGNELTGRRLRAAVAGVRLEAFDTPREILRAVCEGRAEAALMDTAAVVSGLLEGAGCAEPGLRLIPQPEMRGVLGVGATLERAAVADRIREGISALEERGALAGIFTRYNSLASYRLETTEKLISAERWVQRFIGGLIAAGLVLVVLGLVSIGLRRARRRAELSERRFRLLFDQTPVGIFQFDAGLKLTECNEVFPALLGAKREAVIGLDLKQLRDQRVVPALRAAAEGRTGWYEGEYEATKGPARIHVRMKTAPVLDAEGQVVGGVGIVEDVSERVQTERALAESERRFRSLFERVELLAMVTDAEGVVTECNEYALAALGCERGAVIGHEVTEFLAPETRAGVKRIYAECRRGGRELGAEEHGLTTQDGRVLQVQWNHTLLREDGGRFAGIASLGVDVTEHRRLQEQMLQSQKLESIGRLAGGVAHDFNNLLTIINGYAEMLLAGLEGGEAQRGQVEQIRQAGERAASLTAQLLAFSRKQIIKPKPVQVNEEIRATETMLRRLLGEDVECETVLAGDLGLIWADSGQVHQVLLNLVANARDAMPEGGRLTIETANTELDEEYAAGHPETAPGPCVLLTVTDTGVGMDDKTRKSVFEPFFTTKGVGKGTGLGLATVYGIVRQAGGWIWVYSEPGQGTTFKIYWPRLEGCAVEPEGRVAESESGEVTAKVLLVEDQEAVRTLARTVLSGRGYRVMEAASAELALGLVGEGGMGIDLLVTDVVLPGMNGRQLADRLAAVYPEMRVLFVSGYTENVIVTRGVLKPDVAYLAKPFSPKGLLRKVEEVLEGAK